MSSAETTEKTASNKAPVVSFGPYASGSGNSIELAVWSNEILVEGDRKVNVYSISFARNYRDDDGWKKVKTMRPADLPVLVYAFKELKVGSLRIPVPRNDFTFSLAERAAPPLSHSAIGDFLFLFAIQPSPKPSPKQIW